MEKEFIAMAKRCRDEIQHLQNRINRLAPKAQAYDDLSIVLRLADRGQATACEPSLVHELERRIKELTEKKPLPEMLKVTEDDAS